MKPYSLFKRTGYFFIASLLLVLCGYLLTANLRSRPQPEDYLPGNTVALVSWKDFAATFSAFRESPIGREFFSPSFEAVLEAYEIPPRLRQRTVNLFSELRTISDHPLFTSLFHSRSYFALLPSEYHPATVEEYLSVNGLLITGLRAPIDQQNIIRRFIQTKFQATGFSYQGRTINKILLPGGSNLYYSILERTLIIGGDPRPLERCIDYINNRLIRPDNDLGHNPSFSELTRGENDQVNISVYFDSVKLSDDLDDLIQPHYLKNFIGNQGNLHFRHYKNQDTSEITLTFHQPGEGIRTVVDKYFYQPPESSTRLTEIENDVAVFAWTNWLDYSHLWNTLASSSSIETATILFIIGQKIYDYTGVDAETLTSMLGSHTGVYIREAPSVADTHIPLVCFQFQLRKPLEMKNLITGILADVPTRRVVMGDHEAVAIMLAEGLVQPAYAIIGDELMVADSVEMLESYLMLPQKKLVDEKSYRKVKGSLESPGNLIAYARIDKINHALKTMLTWGLNSMQITKKISKQQRSLLDSTFIHPFFQSLDNVHSQGFKVVNIKDRVIIETNIYSP